MSIQTHVNVTLTINNAGISKEGFGTIGLITYKSLGTDPSRTYERVADMITDGFAATSPEVVYATQILAQNPRAKSFKLLHGALPPTQRYQVGVAAVQDSTAYEINVKGEGVTPTKASYTSDGTATNDEIATGLVTSLNAVPGKNFTAATSGGAGSLVVVVTANAPGDWFSLELLNVALLSIAQNHTDPGIATDLASIEVLDNDWYYLATAYNSSAMILSAAASIEATPFKAYLTHTNDSACETLASTGSADVADSVNALGLKRTLCIYHRKPNEAMGAALEGLLCPLDVGTWTAAYKTLALCTADKFTSTQMAHLDSKRCSYYKNEAGVDFLWEGKVGSTSYGFLDVIVSLDFVLDDIQKSIFAVMVSRPKVAYTDPDIKLIESAAEGAVDRAKSDKHKIVAKGTPGSLTDPEPTVSWPSVADIDPTVRALRELPDGAINFRLQGAIHKVDVNLAVTF